VLLAFALAACSDETGQQDAGSEDAGSEDTGTEGDAGEEVICPGEEAVENLPSLIPGFAIVELDNGDSLTLGLADSYTIDQLRGLQLDDTPPELGMPDPPYDSNTDDFEPLDQPYSPEAPYVADGMLPFRFDHFRVEASLIHGAFQRMRDYLSAHGFSSIWAMPREVPGHLPEGTRSYSNRGSYWDAYGNGPGHFEFLGLPAGRYDLLPGIDPEQILPRIRSIYDVNESFHLTIDQEEPSLKYTVEELMAEPFFPQDGTPLEQEEFVDNFFHGLVLAHTWNVQGAREARAALLEPGEEEGSIGIYGWGAFPYPRSWFELHTVDPDPATDFGWNTFRSQVYEVLDDAIISIYPYYGHGDNPQRTVAYSLANVDFNTRFVKDAQENLGLGEKPIVPFLAPVYHGGGADPRWWRFEPLTRMEATAVISSLFFSDIGGVHVWGWGDYSARHHLDLVPGSDPEHGTYAYIKEATPLPPPVSGTSTATALEPYDVIFVIAEDPVGGTFDFNIVDKNLTGDGLPADAAVFRMDRATMEARVRVNSEVYADYVDGLALVRPVEECLKHGVKIIDFPANLAWNTKEPIIRRVRCGQHHLIYSFDPQIAHGATDEPYREMTISMDDSQVTVPADEEPRIYVVKLIKDVPDPCD
jgi:hypothetical protein